MTLSRKSISIVNFLILTLLMSTCHAQSETQSDKAMTQQKMSEIIKEYADSYEENRGVIQFTYNDVDLALVSDARANRMRIIAPIISITELSQETIIATLISNYHLALDARYAVGDGMMFAAYIHPMRELTRAQLESGIRQVASLHNTFGTSFTSGEMSFGVGNPEAEAI